ncbi:MAG: hypothetical protein J07HQW1_03412 [Haloquadratum walsbyi J07HQW1]|uniref:Uncharacterized protein n=1 Tax=Haloquadratum walsbyi J07HQW1 TaxID=1238424 RepID=U1PMA6_9EURY|nr:MAG: hypothetical protein J07HQW1_03412 [Haloquadratum walsbyi J07HQW1]
MVRKKQWSAPPNIIYYFPQFFALLTLFKCRGWSAVGYQSLEQVCHRDLLIYTLHDSLTVATARAVGGGGGGGGGS